MPAALAMGIWGYLVFSWFLWGRYTFRSHPLVVTKESTGKLPAHVLCSGSFQEKLRGNQGVHQGTLSTSLLQYGHHHSVPTPERVGQQAFLKKLREVVSNEFPTPMASGIRIDSLNCCKGDALNDLSPGKGTHIVEQITGGFASVKGIKNRSDNHLQEWHTADPAWISWSLQISSSPFAFLTTCPDRLSQPSILAPIWWGQHSRARARFLLIALHL